MYTNKDISFKNAMYAILRGGKFKLTENGVLEGLGAGRGGIRHIPECCTIIGDIFDYRNELNRDREADIQFHKETTIKIGTGVMLKVKPYNDKKVEIFTLDLSAADKEDDYFLSSRILGKIKNIKVKYVFNNKFMAQQVCYFYCRYSDFAGRGLTITKNSAKTIVRLGCTNLTKKFNDFNFLTQLIGEFTVKWREYRTRLEGDLVKNGFCNAGAFKGVPLKNKWDN